MIAVSAVQRTQWQRADRTAPGTASTAPRGAGVSVRAARFSSGIWSARVDWRTLLNRGIAPARAAGIRSASGSLFTGLGAAPRPQRSGCRGRGIWLSIS